jgi:transcriptional regulator with XRE-family HTH domain
MKLLEQVSDTSKYHPDQAISAVPTSRAQQQDPPRRGHVRGAESFLGAVFSTISRKARITWFALHGAPAVAPAGQPVTLLGVLSRGLSQGELADRSGMSVRAIRNLERGQVEHPWRAPAASLARALALDETDREAFKKAAAGLPGVAEGRMEAQPGMAQIVPRQLPPDIADFTGHELALEGLHCGFRTANLGLPQVARTSMDTRG